MPKKFHKHKLLFDENMPSRIYFPHLNSRFDIKHVRDDLHKDSAEDNEVYEISVAQQRILVTYNVKHFRPLAGSKKDAGIIGLSANLSLSQVDTKLTALLTKSNANVLANKYTALTGEIEI